MNYADLISLILGDVTSTSQQAPETHPRDMVVSITDRQGRAVGGIPVLVLLRIAIRAAQAPAQSIKEIDEALNQDS